MFAMRGFRDGWMTDARGAFAFAIVDRQRTEWNEDIFSHLYSTSERERLTETHTRSIDAHTTQVSALLASPFLLFANALSPITPRAASLADGSEAASTRMGRRGSAFEPRSPGRLVFNSPDRYVGRNETRGVRSVARTLASFFARSIVEQRLRCG